MNTERSGNISKLKSLQQGRMTGIEKINKSLGRTGVNRENGVL